ncbi:hypothetical protein JXB41_07670 [Candidatus Woesearchaeota archaeon]|nr:hypothetical protein [Candidatus Woesearchaeota archaeon]
MTLLTSAVIGSGCIPTLATAEPEPSSHQITYVEKQILDSFFGETGHYCCAFQTQELEEGRNTKNLEVSLYCDAVDHEEERMAMDITVSRDDKTMADLLYVFGDDTNAVVYDFTTGRTIVSTLGNGEVGNLEVNYGAAEAGLIRTYLDESTQLFKGVEMAPRPTPAYTPTPSP